MSPIIIGCESCKHDHEDEGIEALFGSHSCHRPGKDTGGELCFAPLFRHWYPNRNLTTREEMSIIDHMRRTPEGILNFSKLAFTDGYHTPLTEAITLTVHLGEERGYLRKVCTACKDHEQGSGWEYHDCKNEFIVAIPHPNNAGMYGVETVGQCECRGPAHDKRGGK